MKYDVPIVTIHGFKGSALATKDGVAAWIRNSTAVGLSTPNLALPLAWNRYGVQEKDNLVPTHVIKKVGGYYDIYSSWLKKANTLAPSYEFVWDWRRSIREAVLKFIHYIRWIAVKHDSKVQVIAHSAGGVIVLGAMNRHPELFHSVLFAGCPFKANINVYLKLLMGDVAGRNKKVLQTSVGFSFPSALLFLPTIEEYNDEDVGFIFNTSGEREMIDFFNAEHWVTYALGLAAKIQLGEKEILFLKESLKDARLTKEECKFRENVVYPPIAVIASKSFPTLHSAIKDGPNSVLGLSIDSTQKVEGDSAVPWNAATAIPKYVGHTIYESKIEHAQLLNDPQVVKIIEELHKIVGDQEINVIGKHISFDAKL